MHTLTQKTEPAAVNFCSVSTKAERAAATQTDSSGHHWRGERLKNKVEEQ